LSAKVDIILGIYNIFIFVHQFLTTGLSAVVFATFKPTTAQWHVSAYSHPHPAPISVLAPVPVPVPSSNATVKVGVLARTMLTEAVRDLTKTEVAAEAEREARGWGGRGVEFGCVHLVRQGAGADCVRTVLAAGKGAQA